MRSIEIALAADYARRGIWIIPVVLLTITALPLWLFAAFRYDGVLAPDSREAVVLHATLTLMMGFGAAIAVFQSQGKLARHFIRPISASRLVACQMGCGIATIVCMYVIAASVLNLGGAGWPVIGPALFLATSLACSLAAIWSLEGSVFLQFLGCLATSTPLVIWFSRCYGATLMGDWDHMWLNPTAGEALTLCSISLAAFGLAVAGVSRVRRGDVWDLAALQQWWEQQFAGKYAATSFASPRAAQAWCEFRQKMTPAPAILLACFFLFMAALWIFGLAETTNVLELTRTLPLVVMTVVSPLVFGLIAGNCGQESGKTGMRFVLATRPVTDTFLALAMLRNCCTGLLLNWATWLVGFGLIAAGVAWAGYQNEVLRAVWPEGMTIQQLAAISVVLTILSWTFTALMATLVATGRSWLMVGLLSAIFSLFLIFAMLKAYVTPNQFEAITFGWHVLSGSLYLLGTVVAFVAAVRLRLITMNLVLPCVGAWLVATMLFLTIGSQDLLRDAAFVTHCIGVLSLSILPFATMPLAVRWNRHR